MRPGRRSKTLSACFSRGSAETRKCRSLAIWICVSNSLKEPLGRKKAPRVSVSRFARAVRHAVPVITIAGVPLVRGLGACPLLTLPRYVYLTTSIGPIFKVSSGKINLLVTLITTREYRIKLININSLRRMCEFEFRGAKCRDRGLKPRMPAEEWRCLGITSARMSPVPKGRSSSASIRQGAISSAGTSGCTRTPRRHSRWRWRWPSRS